MKYKCQFCDYETDNRARIHKHHIKPRQAGGSNKQGNLVYLCPNHHSKIYSAYSKQGIHTHQQDSIQITRWYFSTGGWVLGYIDENGEQQFTDFDKAHF